MVLKAWVLRPMPSSCLCVVWQFQQGLNGLGACAPRLQLEVSAFGAPEVEGGDKCTGRTLCQYSVKSCYKVRFGLQAHR
jgi:hypothetical protein